MGKKIRYDISKFHIALFKTSPEPYKIYGSERYKKNQSWYVCLTYFKSRGFMQGGSGVSIPLTDWLVFCRAYSQAIKWAKKFGLPVLKHDSELIWSPGAPPTKRQKSDLKQYLGENFST